MAGRRRRYTADTDPLIFLGSGMTDVGDKVVKRKAAVIHGGSIPKCRFTHELFNSVDKTLDALFKERGKRVPFGDFRRSWWRYHCQQLGGPSGCPYAVRDCALAFYRAARLSVHAERPGAMFRVIAKDHAMKRLEGKPLARETQSDSALTRVVARAVDSAAGRGADARPDPGISAPASGDAVDMGSDGFALRRPLSRPVRIGSLLGGDHPRPREVPARDGQETT